MGVPAEDCFKVGELVGVKTMLSEFIAFERLGKRSLLDFSNPPYSRSAYEGFKGLPVIPQ